MTTKPRLQNWSVKRAGGSMTIVGTWPDGTPAKLTRISEIQGDKADGPVAIRNNGVSATERFELA